MLNIKIFDIVLSFTHVSKPHQRSVFIVTATAYRKVITDYKLLVFWLVTIGAERRKVSVTDEPFVSSCSS